ncbi:undecaprenylphosphate N-acetylglucosaminyl transferase WecA [Helicobacter cetorum]|uniref:Undecaprenylphosphate N-acetylglucosaminyl transferase n=1 Tax=Helicobacter cetorum (strain ATCC BAA-540 / CCUG 52418 / MIT 99-5656) TaxID=1163745 RepID=I0ES30_HELCM|nr:glycosyltransferase family 4 protein [Helicobacter cetorum]AFI05749.1 undecaprenylphosphate N-acetylglucosaminyl transferase [Helicobacter cetorum MIT 99-5656]
MLSVLYFLTSFFICSLVVLWSKKSMLFIDNANKIQGFHHAKTPRAGGLGIFFSFVLAYFLEPLEMPFKGVFVFLGLLLVFLSGFLEDINLSLSPKTRLILQSIGIVCILFSTPLVVSDFSPLFSLPYVLAFLFAIFMLVGISNAINIIDGFNGLASGICVITLLVIHYIEPISFACLLAYMVLGFMVLNFPLGKIFLGDGGAYFLGLVCGILLLHLSLEQKISVFFGLNLMLYPVIEVLFSILRRKLRRQKATMPDNLHLHTLLFKALQQRSLIYPNSLCAFILILCNLPFVLVSVFFCLNAPVLIAISLVFIACYLVAYAYLNRQVHPPKRQKF